MKVNFVGKNIVIRDHFKEAVLKKVSRLNKYFREDSADATVTLSTEGAETKRAEITIRTIGSATVFRADQSSEDMLESIDRCVESLVSQIRKNKTKLLKRRQNHESIRFEQIEEWAEEPADGEPEIARVKNLILQPMSPEEACMQMDLVNHDFYLFRDAETDEVHAVYRRKAGNYGLLIPR